MAEMLARGRREGSRADRHVACGHDGRQVQERREDHGPHACKLMDSLETPFGALEKAVAGAAEDGRCLLVRKALERLAERAVRPRGLLPRCLAAIRARAAQKAAGGGREVPRPRRRGRADRRQWAEEPGHRLPPAGRVQRLRVRHAPARGGRSMSDAASFLPALKKAAEATGVVPAAVTADDGYTSAANRRAARELGVGKVSSAAPRAAG